MPFRFLERDMMIYQSAAPSASRVRRVQRAGFTLIELLVVIAIIAVLIGLLLPAVQKVREAANRMSCTNNLKQMALACSMFSDSYGKLPCGFLGAEQVNAPPGVAGVHKTSWMALILPYIEQGNLANLYNFNYDYDAQPNAAAVATQIKLYICPTTPDTPRWDTTPSDDAGSTGWGTPGRAATDYSGLNAIKNFVAHACPQTASVAANASKDDSSIIGIMTRDSNGGGTNAGITYAAIRDGTSNTIMIGEDAGRPGWYGVGGEIISLGGRKPNKEGGWADPNANFSVDGSNAGCTAAFVGASLSDICVPGPTPNSCPLNCTNDSEFFAFHPGGCNAAFADGSVRFLSKNMPLCTLAALVTRSGGEVISDF
jgi:prepilin-type N-terminal cleavage/methylation domain-containing protein/prepilin-type processing-associated H-X9-DG protein